MDDAMISSEDEGGEKCAICLRSFNDQEVGSPESCDHTFCFECIYEWSKVCSYFYRFFCYFTEV